MSHVYFKFVCLWFNYELLHDTYQWGKPLQITVSIYIQFHQLPYLTLCINRPDDGYTQII